MKKDIHPTYNDKVKVTCSCGNNFEVGSTAGELSVEVCSACHPFYTGKKRLVDVAGRVDKFKKRLADAKKVNKATKEKKKVKKTKKEKVVKIG